MNFRELFPYIIIVILAYMFITRPVVVEKNIEIPAKSESFVVEKPVPEVKYDTIYRDSVVEKIVVKENPVNQELLTKYKQAKDSLAKMDIFEDAITERRYKDVFEDSNQTITVTSDVIGSLQRQKVDYNIHSTSIKRKDASEGVYVGVGASLSSKEFNLPSLDFNLSFVKNKKIYTLGMDLNQNIKIGIKQKIF